MAHGVVREGKWRGNWRMDWVASTLTLPRNMVYPALLPLIRTPRLPAVDWTDAPADLNGLVRFGERRNLVSARVPSHFKRTTRPDTRPQYRCVNPADVIKQIVRQNSLITLQTQLHVSAQKNHRQAIFYGAVAPSEAGSPQYRGFTITLRYTTIGRASLDE